MRPISFLAALPALALAACGAPDDNADTPTPDGTEDAMPVEPDGGIGDGATPPGADAAGGIPTALHGRWGLVAADCTSTRGDAKGLIEVNGEAVTFYESRATLGDVAERDGDSIRATFAFTGEGMEWTRDMALEAADGGEALIRTEYGEDAMPEPLRYIACPAEGDA